MAVDTMHPMGVLFLWKEVMKMTVHEMRETLGETQGEFAARYKIPFRTIQNWEAGVRNPPEYILTLLENRVQADAINRRSFTLPMYDSHKNDLPDRKDFMGSIAWLRAVQNCLGNDIVFALDEALMCEGYFGGRNDEYLVWVYGKDAVTRYNGVVVLGNQISDRNVVERNGLLYTDFNRTISDALANESILDMQGITEAISKYYYQNGESFRGITVAPEYQQRFDRLAEEAICYYDS